MKLHLPATADEPPCEAPTIAAASVLAGAIYPGSHGSQWIAEAGPRGEDADDVSWYAGGRWTLYRTAGEPEALYYTHDNRSKPLVVRVTPRVVAAYKRPLWGYFMMSREFKRTQHRRWLPWRAHDRSGEHIWDERERLREDEAFRTDRGIYDDEMPELYSELVLGPMPYSRVMAGVCITTDESEDDPIPEDDEVTPGDFGLGNSVLIEAAPHDYYFVGKYILHISLPDDTLEQLFSPIGNNDVPYPFAIGHRAVYLLIEDVFLPLETWERDAYPDPYHQFYFNSAGLPKPDRSDPNFPELNREWSRANRAASQQFRERHRTQWKVLVDRQMVCWTKAKTLESLESDVDVDA